MDFDAKLRGKTVLVTGGAGFIGSHLCERLLSHGAWVICFDNFLTGDRAFVRSLAKKDRNFTCIEGDANESFSILRVLRVACRIDYIFHYASVVGVQRTMEDPMGVFRDIQGIRNITDFARDRGVKKIIFSSSSEVYGDSGKIPYVEDTSPRDIKNPYSAVKILAEMYLKNWSLENGIPTTSLRFFNVYGPRQQSSAYGFVVGIFISQALAHKPLTVFNDGLQTRDFTYIDDNVEAALRALLLPETDNEIINVGTGIETSVINLATQIGNLAGAEYKIEKVYRPDLIDARRRVADTGKMEKLLRFSPSVFLPEGLRKTIAAFVKF